MSALSPPPQLAARFRADVAALAGDPDRIGVAVSGGPDSLALLLLSAAAFPGRTAAATVDHGLRAESGAEARFVAGVCADLGVPHIILEVEVDVARASIQNSAREARYAALDRWLADIGVPMLATAHHVDDQAETLMMRLIRGAGVGGLGGVRAVTPLPAAHSQAMLIRPLLGWRRAELRAIVEAAGITPVDDPSNTNPDFDRVRIRQHLAGSGWIDPSFLARSAAALAQADAALDWTVAQLWRERVSEDSEDLSCAHAGLPAELKRRLLVAILTRLAPAAAPRGQEITRLLATLEAGGTAALAGILCKGGERWVFSRAPPRRRSG
jgi:tRNA(Ile)-lysidine synthase